jgi:SulP family sulfate permease
VSRLFGHEPDGAGTLAAFGAIPEAITSPVIPALAVGLLALAMVFFWPKSFSRYVPAPLAALVTGTVVGRFTGVPTELTLGEIPTGLPSMLLPTFSGESLMLVLEAAVILAVLGSIDSLLTSLVADTMTGTRHKSNQELIGQGVGNAVAGLFGGIPGAGATMRTVVNIRTGGETRISGMMHSLVLVAVVLVAAPLAATIPHAVLAGILVKVGYDIIDWTYLKRAHAGPRWDLLLMVLVLLLTVFLDLITAVAVGVVLAALAFVKQMADLQLKTLDPGHLPDFEPEERAILDAANARVALFDFAGGPLSFGAAADLGHKVRERAKDGISAIVLDFTRVPFIDLSAAKAVETIACDARQAGKALYVTGMNAAVTATLGSLHADHCITAGARFERRIDALRDAAAKAGVSV